MGQDAAIHNHLLALYAQDEEWRERAAASAAAAATSLAPVSSLESPWGAEAGTAAAGIAGVAVKPLEGQDDAGHLGDVKRSSGMMGSAVGVDSGKVRGRLACSIIPWRLALREALAGTVLRNMIETISCEQHTVESMETKSMISKKYGRTE